jgi:hypothetical protein
VRTAATTTDLNPSQPEQIIRLGQEALARLRRAWSDWMAIAEALQLGRAELMAELHTNSPTGRRYETRFCVGGKGRR